ncbi:MAG: DUF4012 domain-containing protein [Candidatus Pacebacteria bacterium]|nr:DUF4012 domain-containing protein [Candidatus Paceibacterota bacterium]
MFGQKKQLTTEVSEVQPTVLLLLEEENAFTRQLIGFFENNNLGVKLLFSKSFLEPEQALAEYQAIRQVAAYKLLVVTGFKPNFAENPDFLLRVAQAIEESFVQEGQVLPTSFLINYSSPTNVIDLGLDSFKLFWTRQNSFLNEALKSFPLAQFCLLEDYVDLDFDFSLKFNLYFSLFEQHLLLNSQGRCYWQSKDGFFKHFEKIFFQAKSGGRVLLRGQKEAAANFLEKARDLCDRYFLEKFSIAQLFVKKQENEALLADFIKMYYPDEFVNKILDQKIRRLPISLNTELKHLSQDLMTIQAQKTANNSSPQRTSRDEVKTPKVSEPEPVKDKIKTQVGELKTQASEETAPPLNNNVEEQKKLPETNNFVEEKPAVKNNENKVVKKKIDKSIDIDKKLQDIFRSEQRERQDDRFNKNLKGAHKIVKKSKFRRLSFYVGIILASFGSLILILFASFYLSQKNFENNLLSFMEKQEAQSFEESFAVSQRKTSFFKWQLDNYQKIIGRDILSTPLNYWQIFNEISQEQKLANDLRTDSYNLYQEVLRSDGDPEEFWSIFLNKSKEHSQQQQVLYNQLEQLNLDILSENKAKIISTYQAQLLKKIKIQQRAQVFLEALSQLILSPARSNIVFLVQDSNELRSSGGFLVSAITLSFENSRLLNWQVYDVPALDQRIYGDRVADDEIKQLLLAEKLQLRDANWPVNFVDAGTDIAWFIEQSLSLTPDLIIGINSKSLAEIAKPLYPIVINNVSVNENNFFEELLRQENFDFGKFSQELTDRLLAMSATEFEQVFAEFVSSLETRETLITSRDEQLASILQKNLWSGGILDTPCPSDFSNNSEQCFTDGIYQLENNVGLNKVNRLITQEINHSIGISDKFIRHKRVIKFNNLSRQNYWPEGNYQSYLKFYLPKNANLEKISFNGTALPSSNYNLFEENNRLVLSYRFAVPILSTGELEIIYLIPHQLTAPFSYVFLDQKQAGVFNKTSNYKVLFAESFQAKLIAPQATYDNKEISFVNNNLDNFLFAVAF